MRFYFGKTGSELLKPSDFGFKSHATLRKACLELESSSTKFKVYDIHKKTACRRTCIRLPMTCVKPKYRELLYKSVYRISKARYVASNTIQGTVMDLATIRNPEKRAYDFNEFWYREKGRDMYCTHYKARGLSHEGDHEAMRSLCKRDGSNFLEHIQRALIKCMSQFLAFMLNLDHKSNQVALETEIMDYEDAGLSKYISSTIKYLHRQRGVKTSFIGQTICKENKKNVSRYIEMLLLYSCGASRFDDALFDKPEALSTIFLCRRVLTTISSFLDSKSVDVSLAPIAKGWCHLHIHWDAFNRLIRAAPYEIQEIEKITDILQNERIKKRITREARNNGIQTKNLPGFEFQSDGCSVVFAYDTTMVVEMKSSVTSNGTYS